MPNLCTFQPLFINKTIRFYKVVILSALMLGSVVALMQVLIERWCILVCKRGYFVLLSYIRTSPRQENGIEF